MNTEPTSSTAEASGHSPFPKTLWTECVEPASEGNSSASEAALRQLCADYREPILVWLRRRGTDPVAAEDLTHGFIEFLLESNRLGSVERGKGRFRSFLLKCLTRYVRGEWRKRMRRPPGADEQPEPLDEQSLPGIEADLPSLLDREFALAAHRRALERLRQDFATNGRGDRFRVLEPFILGLESELSYAEVGQQLGLKPNAVKKAVFDLRDDYYQAFRAEITQTAASREEVDDEMRYLVPLLVGVSVTSSAAANSS